MHASYFTDVGEAHLERALAANTSPDWMDADKENNEPGCSQDTLNYMQFLEERDTENERAQHHSDKVVDEICDSENISGATTQPAVSFDSISSPPPTIQHPATEVEERAFEHGPLHTVPVECGGLNMTELKDAMTKESDAQEPLVAIIGMLLDKTVARNDGLKRVSKLHDFESDRACSLGASEYLSRMMRYGKCSPSCAVVGLIYLQRIKQRTPSACVTSNNLQRLLLVAVLLANKYLDDLYYSNKHWAKIGGITLQEINALELTVLRLLDWKMNVTREDYLAYLEELGCGPQNNTTDTAAWAKDLYELKNLVASGVGIRLYNEITTQNTQDARTTAPAHVAAATTSAGVYAQPYTHAYTHTTFSSFTATQAHCAPSCTLSGFQFGMSYTEELIEGDLSKAPNVLARELLKAER